MTNNNKVPDSIITFFVIVGIFCLFISTVSMATKMNIDLGICIAGFWMFALGVLTNSYNDRLEKVKR